MADQLVTGDSKEAVAYALMMGIALEDGKVGQYSGIVLVKAEAQWVLDTYKKCLETVLSAQAVHS